jgi:hypothetical protein
MIPSAIGVCDQSLGTSIWLSAAGSEKRTKFGSEGPFFGGGGGSSFFTTGGGGGGGVVAAGGELDAAAAA